MCGCDPGWTCHQPSQEGLASAAAAGVLGQRRADPHATPALGPQSPPPLTSSCCLAGAGLPPARRLLPARAPPCTAAPPLPSPALPRRYSAEVRASPQHDAYYQRAVRAVEFEMTRMRCAAPPPPAPPLPLPACSAWQLRLADWACPHAGCSCSQEHCMSVHSSSAAWLLALAAPCLQRRGGQRRVEELRGRPAAGDRGAARCESSRWAGPLLEPQAAGQQAGGPDASTCPAPRPPCSMRAGLETGWTDEDGAQELAGMACDACNRSRWQGWERDGRRAGAAWEGEGARRAWAGFAPHTCTAAPLPSSCCQTRPQQVTRHSRTDLQGCALPGHLGRRRPHLQPPPQVRALPTPPRA